MEKEFELDLNLRPGTPEDLFHVTLLGKTKEIRMAAFKEFLIHIHSSTTYLLRIRKNTKDKEIKSICEDKIKNREKVQYFLSLINPKNEFVES
ncbi:MAG: hypothetical protein QG630_224 [Patescibacteria group bacterium]|nr:hypothetical protein [Patescibacteria group bacterium]